MLVTDPIPAPRPYPPLHAHGRSVTGYHAVNEDSFLVDEVAGCFAVADGVGGAPAGELASQAVIDGLDANSGPGTLIERGHRMLRAARAEVMDRATGRSRGMASTLACLVVEGTRALVLHAGDSRVYRLRHGTLALLTEDHTVRNELLREGENADWLDDRAGGSLTRCIGSFPVPHHRGAVMAVVDARPGDRFLVCTDGLTKVVPHQVIANTLANNRVEGGVLELLAEASRRVARDDVTVVVVEVR